MRIRRNLGLVFLCASVLQSCAVGPGTPLVKAVNPDQKARSGTVQPPAGYGPPNGSVQSQGLINPLERAKTEEYLSTLADAQ